LEYEKVKREVGGRPAEKVAEELFALQKQNHEELKEKFARYQPSAFGKAWGADPDYLALSKHLKERLLGDGEENPFEESKKKLKKKKKGTGRHH
jgi:hypothetical protein